MEAPAPQGYLNKIAKQYYYLICAHLDTANAIESIDSFGISQMAFYLDLFHQAALHVDKEGPVQVFPTGATNVTGWFSVLKECDERFIKLSAKFGMSAKDRELMKQFNIRKRETDSLDEL